MNGSDDSPSGSDPEQEEVVSGTTPEDDDLLAYEPLELDQVVESDFGEQSDG